MVARVILRGAKTYQFAGKRWIKDVPGIVKGESNIKQYQQNAYFIVKVLEGKKSKKEEPEIESKSEKKSSKTVDAPKKKLKSRLKK